MKTTSFIELHQMALAMVAKYPSHRAAYDRVLARGGRHHLGIIGPRGVGKTVLLRQLAAREPQGFYLSADTLGRDADAAWDLINALHKDYGYTSFYIDEIHFIPDAAGLLKRLYDFTELRLVFSSSVALAMRASAYDVSRRVELISMPLFSFREYLSFRHGIRLNALSLEDLVQRRWLPEHLRSAAHFRSYLKGGMLPFALEEPDPLVLLANIRDKVISRDIPSVARLAVEELDLLSRALQFIGRSAVDGINYTSLSANLGITKYKAQQYIGLLDQAFVLQQLFPSGTGVLKEPKVLMMPPYRLLYGEFEERIGGLREDFAAMALLGEAQPLTYLKSLAGAKTPDFLVEHDGERWAMEIGGKGKGRQQFKGIQVDRKLVFADCETPVGSRLPLFLLGFLS